MIEFNSLMDGLHYLTICPLCQGRITLAGDGTRIVYGDWGETRVTLEVDRNKIHVDPRTGRILSVELPDDKEALGSITGSYIGSTLIVTKVHWKLPTSGLFFTPVNINCPDCNRYYVTLQVQFNMDQRKIFKVLLNSEHLYIKEDERELEINNIYTTEATEFSEINTGKLPSVTTLPLIPMDHQNVNAFVKRVKNLIIFS